jgi:hypothetical protein
MLEGSALQRLLNAFGPASATPRLLGREVVEGEQLVAVLRELLDGLWIFRRIDRDAPRGHQRLGLGFGIPDVRRVRVRAAVLHLGRAEADQNQEAILRLQLVRKFQGTLAARVRTRYVPASMHSSHFPTP